MSAPFQPGDVIECIDDSPPRDIKSARNRALFKKVCRIGAVYRVRDTRLAWAGASKGSVAVRLVGINSEPLAGFRVERFRKIDDEQIPEVLERLKALGKQRERVS